MKKVLLWIVGILAALCIAVACIWGGEISTLRTVKCVGTTIIMRLWLDRCATVQEALDLRNWNDYETTVHFAL